MGCVSAAGVRIAHEFAVAVISRDKQSTSRILYGLGELANARIDGLNGPNCGRQDARMADHVGISIVQYDQIIFAGSDRIQGFAGKLGSRHFWLKVVGCNLGRGDQDPFLTGIWIFPATVKEVGDVGIFLSLSHAQLCAARCGHDLTKNVR